MPRQLRVKKVEILMNQTSLALSLVDLGEKSLCLNLAVLQGSRFCIFVVVFVNVLMTKQALHYYLLVLVTRLVTLFVRRSLPPPPPHTHKQIRST